MMELLSGFILGFIGSFHCAVMCGPIALAIPRNADSRWSFIKSRLVYNSGRVITYALLGLIFGFLGDRIFLLGLQQSLSIGIGIVILLSVILSFSGEKYLLRIGFIGKLFTGYKNAFRRLFIRKNKNDLFFFGIMNGFLPCGFVYIALSGAMVSADVLKGSGYMFLFGLGTIPMMLSVSLFGTSLTKGIRNRISKLVPLFTIILGLLFIVRGLNLGIPYISPASPEKGKTVKEELICIRVKAVTAGTR